MEECYNIALCIEYDGTDFRGWQAQKTPPVRSVESVLVPAIEIVANHTIELLCAGRTDAGVHARNQIVNFITNANRTDYAWIRGINSNLPADCSVKSVFRVPLDFHARFSAVGRHYQYIIHNTPYRSALLRKCTTHINYSLNVEKMNQAAQFLVGVHDFNAFRSSECQAVSPVREIYAIHIYRHSEMIFLDIHANGFLHHMVRNIVGTLLKVGSNKEEIDFVKSVLESKDRRNAGITAPPQGLYLDSIDYPASFNIHL